MGEAANRVSLAAAGQSQSIEGNVSIAASETYAAMLLPPIVARLRREHPGITTSLSAISRPPSPT
jgi:DNA-binding transcriptional LysR family regulator